jgi:dephospho-CoA kinase
MFVVGLTGGIGSGKSEAAKIFAELGVPVTDVDVISHALTAANQPLLADITANFGNQYITPEGALNRAAMRELVFNDASARDKLNAILHPAIYAQTLLQLETNQKLLNKSLPYQILAIPLLFESPRYAAHINRILLIDCDETTQIARVKLRSKLAQADIKKIIKAQTSRSRQLKLANDVIQNMGTVAELREKILATHQKYLNTCIVSKTT